MDCVKYLYNRSIKNNIPCHYCGSNYSYLPKNNTRIRCRKCKNTVIRELGHNNYELFALNNETAKAINTPESEYKKFEL